MDVSIDHSSIKLVSNDTKSKL